MEHTTKWMKEFICALKTFSLRRKTVKNTKLKRENPHKTKKKLQTKPDPNLGLGKNWKMEKRSRNNLNPNGS